MKPAAQPPATSAADPGITTAVRFSDIDFEDPIFDSLSDDYPDFHDWVQRCRSSSDNRIALIFANESGAYRAVTILKFGESSIGDDPRGMKISTFRVAPDAQGVGYADKMLEKTIQLAFQRQIEEIFITIAPRHEDLVRYLERAGFRRAPTTTSQGEFVYSAELSNYERMYPYLNRLAYDVLASEYDSRSIMPGPSQETPTALANLLTEHIDGSCKRLLELGPGAGSVLAELVKRSEQTVGIEISPAMASLSSRRAPDATIIIANARDVSFPAGHFDGIFAGAFLHLFPKVEAERMISQMAAWTRVGGAILVNTTISDVSSEGLEDKLDYVHRVARFRSRWSEEEFQNLLILNGLRITARATTNERERSKYWVAFVCEPSRGVD